MVKVIGLTGSIACGKSTVSQYLITHGYKVLDADCISKEALNPGTSCFFEVERLFQCVENGVVNRQKLGQIVFADHEKLRLLNQIMHPAVKASIVKMIQEQEESQTTYFVIEAALLIEEQYHLICDELWYIYCDENIRRERLKSSRGYTDEKINAIMGSQLSEQNFRKECQIMIDNSGDFEDTCYQIDKAMKC